jgi:hypothetical protein
VSSCIGLVGVALLAYEIRLHRRHHDAPVGAHNESVDQALRH